MYRVYIGIWVFNKCIAFLCVFIFLNTFQKLGISKQFSSKYYLFFLLKLKYIQIFILDISLDLLDDQFVLNSFSKAHHLKTFIRYRYSCHFTVHIFTVVLRYFKSIIYPNTQFTTLNDNCCLLIYKILPDIWHI